MSNPEKESKSYFQEQMNPETPILSPSSDTLISMLTGKKNENKNNEFKN